MTSDPVTPVASLRRRMAKLRRGLRRNWDERAYLVYTCLVWRLRQIENKQREQREQAA